jgi:hypothetical protein
MVDELVWVLSFDVVFCKLFLRKVLEVERDNRSAMSFDGGGQDVPIFGVGKVDRVNQAFILFDQAVRHRLVHEVTSASELFDREIVAISQNTADPFIMDAVRPSCSEKP